MKTITITAGGVEAAVEKKRIKNMYIRVFPPDGRVKITAPLRTPDETIRGFLASHAAWAEKQREKLAGRPETEHTYETGEMCFLWGRQYRLAVVTGSRNTVRAEGPNIILQVREGGTPEERAQIMARFYRGELSRAVPPVLEQYERMTGVHASEWRIRDMKTRWGTCNTAKKRVWLNLKLAQKPPECLEYVIAHELAHLLEHSHNAVFWAYMDKFYPDWRAVRARLNGRNGV